jgi:hypothetical protein
MPGDSKQESSPAPIPVRALRLGYYGNARKRAGDEFTVKSEQDVGTWMERLDTKAPKKK